MKRVSPEFTRHPRSFPLHRGENNKRGRSAESVQSISKIALTQIGTLFEQASYGNFCEEYVHFLRSQVQWVDLSIEEVNRLHRLNSQVFVKCFDRFDVLNAADQERWDLAVKLGMFKSLVGGFLLLLGASEDIQRIFPLFLSIIDAWQEGSIPKKDDTIEPVFRALLKKYPHFLITASDHNLKKWSGRVKFFIKYSENVNDPMEGGFPMTPLEHAVKVADWMLFKELCQAGADPLGLNLSRFADEELRALYQYDSRLIDRFDAFDGSEIGEHSWRWKLALELGCFKSLLGPFLNDSIDVHLNAPLFMHIIDRWNELGAAQECIEVKNGFCQMIQRCPYLFYCAIVLENERTHARLDFFLKFSEDIDRSLFPGTGITPIGYAGRLGLQQLFEASQKYGADIFKKDLCGKSALEYFLEGGPSESELTTSKRRLSQEKAPTKKICSRINSGSFASLSLKRDSSETFKK